jgi:hypothetical protein
MGSDKSIFVLDLKGRLEEPVHKLQQLLVVLEKPAPVDIVEIQIEETFILAAFEQLLSFFRLLREDSREIDRLHGVDWDLFSVPLDPSGYFCCRGHDVR